VSAAFRKKLQEQDALEYSLIELVELSDSSWEARAWSEVGMEHMRFIGPTANGDAVKFIAGRWPRLDVVRPLEKEKV
jgi:hypothetical protein